MLGSKLQGVVPVISFVSSSKVYPTASFAATRAIGNPVAFEANALAVRNLAIASRQSDARLVHFSTDYVFDGKLGRPYVETDQTHPLGAYAVSKLAGELYARAYLPNALVVRTSGVFGPAGVNTRRGNFPELMMRLAREGKPIRVVEDHVASPTFAPLLAARSIDLVERELDGIFHVGGGEAISWFDFARMIFRQAGIEGADLQPTNEREYRTTADIGGKQEQMYGTACRQPDGSWKAVK